MNRHGIRRQRCFSLYVPPQQDKQERRLRSFTHGSTSFDETLCKSISKMTDILSNSDGDIPAGRNENFHRKLCRSEAHFLRKTFQNKEKLCEKDCKKERRNSTDGSVVHFLNRNDPHWRTANTTKDTSVLNSHRLLRRSNPAYRGVNFTGKRQVSVA
ncbi:unnamed protein product [Mytilus edulis]|uniref:Uncharacterized protein n=1 Tax=Mytilus edulis TaxID=6550 RepID=A0A8S3UC26_MYTED|nr:unnamed protein product [Mytilus edulis]